jgi:hypothetical protein
VMVGLLPIAPVGQVTCLEALVITEVQNKSRVISYNLV